MLSYKLKSWGIWKVRTRTVGLLGVWASFLEEVVLNWVLKKAEMGHSMGILALAKCHEEPSMEILPRA